MTDVVIEVSEFLLNEGFFSFDQDFITWLYYN